MLNFDNNILQAIKHHSDGADNSILSQIIYCADKIEATRPYPVSELQKQCLKNLRLGKLAVAAIVAQKIKE